MKVLFITRKFPPQKGGMELYSYNLINNYEGEKKIIALGKSQKNLIWFYPWCLIYIIFSNKKYDIIELGDMLLCGIGWMAKKLNPNIKIVVTVHGLDITYKNLIYQLYLKLFSKKLDLYVPNSTYTKNIAEQKGLIPTKIVFPATLVENRFCDIKEDRKLFCKKYNISEKSIILCTTGRLVKRKGVEWFILNVMPLLRNIEVYYLVVGSGYMKEEIENAIKETGDVRVKLLGRVSDYDLDEIYINSDIFIMPNINVINDVEGYGMVAIEAAAAECIVIASDIQGIKDAIRNNINGILVQPENEKEFAEKIIEVADNYSEFKIMKKAAREYVLKECSGKAIAKQYKQIFHELY